MLGISWGVGDIMIMAKLSPRGSEYLYEQLLTVNSVEGGAWLLVVVRSMLGIIATINILGSCAAINNRLLFKISTSILGIIATINILGSCATISNRLLFKISTSRRLSTATQQPADRVRTLRRSNIATIDSGAVN